MDYLDIQYKNDEVILKDIENFDIKQVFECGQCFRWQKESENRYVGIAFGKVLDVEQQENTIILHNTCKEDFDKIWRNYFDLDRDYAQIKKELSQDATLRKSVEFGYGIRVLNQEPFEMVISYIISARNSIPVITRTINNISEKWGNAIEYNGKTYYTFPSVEVLARVSEQELRDVGGSFRSPYIVDTSNKIYNSILIKQGKLEIEEKMEFLTKYDLDSIIALDDDACHDALQNYNGVGAKVADCIMLFSMGKTSAFPVDVWIKRAMMHFYDASDMSLPKMRMFGRDRFGKLSGFAQQYLFYYARENGIKL